LKNKKWVLESDDLLMRIYECGIWNNEGVFSRISALQLLIVKFYMRNPTTNPKPKP